MSSNLSDLDKIKFKSKLTLGDHSPKLNKHIADNPSLAVTISLSCSFIKELSKAKENFTRYTYIDILNTQIESFQLKYSERLESRLRNKTVKVLWLGRKLTGRKRIEFDSTVHKIAVLSDELENVKNLNYTVDKFKKENLDFEQKCLDLHEKLEKELLEKECLLEKNHNLIDEIESVKDLNKNITEYVRKLHKKVATPNSGKDFSQISENNKSRKLREFKSKAETALWFAESYGLVPQYLKLQNTGGQTLKVDFQQSLQQKSRYQELPDTEKQKIKDLLFILEKFNISESAYRELTLFCDGLPRKYLISQCRDHINSFYHFERTPGNIPGAYMSLEGEISRYIKYNCNEGTDKIQVKISGDGSKISRISNFVVFSFSVITDETKLSSKDQNVFCIVNCKEDYDNLKQSCMPIFQEINNLYERGTIDVDGRTRELDILIGGDMKFLQILLGLGGSLCNFSCPWCRIHKNEREDMTKSWDFYHSVCMKRTSQNLKDDSVHNSFGVRSEPLIKVQPENIVIDELHLLLRICDKLLRNLILDAKTLDEKNSILGKKTELLNQLVDKIRECGVSFFIWSKKGTQGELEWSSLTGSDYKRLLENLPSKLCFLIHHDTHDITVDIWNSFLKLYRFITEEVHSFSSTETVFEKCRDWVKSFLTLDTLGRKGFDSVTPYMHCLVYHVPFFAKKYGKLINFSGQGVEKINDDIKKIHHSKTNKWDATVDALQVRKRIEHLATENCEREKRSYNKLSDSYWDHDIFKQRSAKKAKIIEEMSQVSEKYASNISVSSDFSIDGLSTDEIKGELKKLRLKTKLRNREKLLALLKNVMSK